MREYGMRDAMSGTDTYCVCLRADALAPEDRAEYLAGYRAGIERVIDAAAVWASTARPESMGN
jgi:hypothetical protein